MKLNKILQISLWKSLLFNLKSFGINGISFPVLISRKCRLDIHGKVKLTNYRFNKVAIGFGGSVGVVENRYSYFGISKGATVIFKGKAGISSGNSIRVDSGVLVIGDKFSTNKNCFIACSKGIAIGDDVTLGWNVNIRDSDGHKVGELNDSQLDYGYAPVNIGNHVWVCSHSHVLKGTSIPDDSVVAYGSLTTKTFEKPNSLIGGSPAKVIKENIRWEY